MEDLPKTVRQLGTAVNETDLRPWWRLALGLELLPGKRSRQASREFLECFRAWLESRSAREVV